MGRPFAGADLSTRRSIIPHVGIRAARQRHRLRILRLLAANKRKKRHSDDDDDETVENNDENTWQ